MTEDSSAKVAKPSGEVARPTKSISDVARPDETAAEPSAKPVLITNRPIIKDPMVVSEPGENPDVAKRSDKPELELKPTASSETDKPKEPSKEPSKEPTEEETETDQAEPAKDAGATPVDINDEAEVAKQAEHDEAIQKMVDSKQYYLPINSVEKRRSKRFVLLGIVLSLLLAIAWVDVALDAHLIHIGNTKPVTHFFSN